MIDPFDSFPNIDKNDIDLLRACLLYHILPYTFPLCFTSFPLKAERFDMAL